VAVVVKGFDFPGSGTWFSGSAFKAGADCFQARNRISACPVQVQFKDGALRVVKGKLSGSRQSALLVSGGKVDSDTAEWGIGLRVEGSGGKECNQAEGEEQEAGGPP
jgi:hypothetical protein